MRALFPIHHTVCPCLSIKMMKMLFSERDTNNSWADFIKAMWSPAVKYDLLYQREFHESNHNFLIVNPLRVVTLCLTRRVSLSPPCPPHPAS